MSLLSRIFGDPNKKEISRYAGLVNQINELEASLEKKDLSWLSDQASRIKQKISRQSEEIIKQTAQVEDRYQRNQLRKKELNSILEENKAYVFALVREAAKRVIGLRHYDVQLIGAAVLHQGQIAEMKTGEGKTLVASLALVLNAMTGLGAHLVTVNDYLARRDAGWMGPLYHTLGLSVGVVGPQFSLIYDPDSDTGETDERLKHFREVSRKEAYQADITYGTNNEFGFDYLRDNMAQLPQQISQRELTYAIVDEVDSILIDEARTPLIISAPAAESAELYRQFAKIIPRLKRTEDYTVDEKQHAVSITESGIRKLEEILGVENLYSPEHVELVHHADTSLKAYALYKKNKDYVVKNGEVMIVDEFTGRLLQGRRYSSGLHQAIEAKEGVAVKEESVTLATITFQNYFRLYTKLAGMTGTALTEAEEFSKIYRLETLGVPTHRPNVRIDRQDIIYKTQTAKYQAVVELVKELQKSGQPVLIGTVSIAKSEALSKLMKAESIKHSVLNAKQHQKEGEIIAQAGRLGSVTVATNMAGRGVDIILGGFPPRPEAPKKEWQRWEEDHQKVIELGGLFVIGTERHESRRIDNQLRGRAGRQGDPGVTQFFLSLEDDLMRIFGGERVQALMERFNIPEDMSINNPLITKAIEQAQRKVESHNFEIRKQLVDYDDVMNRHREAIYRRRLRALLLQNEQQYLSLRSELLSLMSQSEKTAYENKASHWPEESRRQIEQLITLRAIDVLWVEHLKAMEALREGIGLRGYGQREPLVEYKQESFKLFQNLLQAVDQQIVDLLLRAQLTPESTKISVSATAKQMNAQAANRQDGSANKKEKVGRNDPCPCGAINPNTGKPYKYKHCGLIDAPHHRG